jgi:subtilase family serine protease
MEEADRSSTQDRVGDAMQLPPVGRLVMVSAVMVSAVLACTVPADRAPPAQERQAARAAPSSTRHDADSPRVRLKGFTLDLRAPAPPVPLELDLPHAAKKEHAAARPVKWIVQLGGPIGPEHPRELAALGARIVEYVPDHAVIVAMDDDAAARVKAHGAVHGAARLRPAYKIDPALKDDAGAVARWDGHRRLAIRFDEGEGFEAAVSEVHKVRGQVLHLSRGVVTVKVPSSAVARLARLESVTWIGELPELRLLNDTTSWTIQTSREDDRAIWAHGLRGRGQIVGMGDSGIDHDMCFFRDPAGVPIGPSHRKIVGHGSFADAWDGDMGHGTHVAGTVAGDQSPVTGAAQASGMAPEARLYVTDLSPGESLYVLPPPDLGELFVAPYLAGARLHTNSWGGTANAYESYAWSVDRFTWEHKDFLPLFANGNAGPGLETVGTPATAKNVVSVGATYNGGSDDVATFSSHGPTLDGRTKPTVMAPGVAVVSADSDGLEGTSNCGTTTMSGTSMATPAVAGAAALVRQYYADGYWPYGAPSPAHAREPSAALVKATLLNSARNMAGQNVDAAIPSTGQGWGRVTLDRTLRFTGDAQYLEVFDVQDGLVTGAAWAETFFASGGRPFKVTLVWTDYPASGQAAVALVNDLDLLVTAPDGARHAGNDFSGGASAAGGAPDRINVEEQVLVPAPLRGRYTVTVSAHQVVFGPQPFAVVVTGGAGVTSTGFVGLDRSRYGAPDTLRVEVSDADPNVDPALPDRVVVTVTSGADAESVTLVESGPDTGIFAGTLATASGVPVPDDGVLTVVDGAPIVATYVDADDGSGAPAVATGDARADLTPPRVSAVGVTEIGQGSALVAWSTDEPASGKVEYGTTAALGETRTTPWLTTAHGVRLGGLREATAYRLVVTATDEAGNATRDANGGALYAFTTLSLPPDLTAFSSNSTRTAIPETVIYGIATDPSGVVSILVNDRPAAYRASDGYYELAVPLVVGENPFAVLARDGLGNVATAQLVVTRVPPPDLTIAAVSGPARGGVGERIHIEQTVCNVGPGEAPGTGYVAWFLSTDGVISPDTDVAFPGVFRSDDVIPAGECLPISVDVATPMDPSLVGNTYVLGSYVDVTNELCEPDETNNARAGAPILIEGPDLVVSAVSAPATIETGVEFAAPVTVVNRGLGASGPFAVAVYLSWDEQITRDDLLLATCRPGALRAGATVELPFHAIVAGSVAPGDYFVGAIADLGDEVREPDESNNARAGNRVTVRGPDLVVTSVQGPASAASGSAVTLTVTVGERGGGGASGFAVGLFLSTDAIIERTDRRIGGYQLAALARGASETTSTAVVLPTDLAVGTYRLGAIVDERDAVAEADETNNATAGAALTIGGADLFVTQVVGPTSALPARTAQVTTTVAASGAGSAATGFHVGIFLSTDATITPSDTLIGTRHVAGLAPGAQSTETTTVSIPWDAAGTYYLGAIADDFPAWVCDSEIDACWWVQDVVKESDETNNAATGNAVFVGNRTDLAVTAVTGPATALPGGSITVSTTVTNTGTVASAACRLGIYLSTDPTIGAGDVLLATRSVPALAPGAASAEATAVTLPANAAGTYWLGAIADLDGVVAEADEVNNALAAPSVLAIGLPDLAIAAVTGPATGVPGGSVTVSTTVTNAGAVASAACRLGIYLSTDPTIGAGDVLLATRSVPALAPGAASAEATAVTLPANAAGAYWLGAIADLDGVVAEADEVNNALAASAPLTIGLPDLVVAAVTGPATGLPGGSITVSTTVTNTGTVASAACRVGIYLSTDPTIGAGDVLLATRSVPALAPGAASAEATAVTLPANAAGTYWLGAIADLDGVVAEAGEANNALAASAPLTIGLPDLVASAVTGPSTGAPGGSVTVSTTVKNAGVVASAACRVGIYLSADATIGAGDVLLATRSVPALAPGAANSEATAVTLPASAAGTYWLGAIADLDGVVAEADEANNTLAASAPLSVGQPDLAVTSVSGTGRAPPGGTLRLSALVVNHGGAPTGAFTVAFYISRDGTITTSDTLVSREVVAGLAPGASVTVASLTAVPETVPIGTYALGAIADVDGLVAEPDELDNAFAGTRLNVRAARY